MSVQAMSWVIDHSQSKGQAYTVLLMIANRVNEKEHGDAVCWPSQETLAEESRCSVRTVQRCLDQLVTLGEIEREHRGQHASNMYRMTYFQRRQSDVADISRGDKSSSEATNRALRGDTGGVLTVRNRNYEPGKEKNNQPVRFDVPDIEQTAHMLEEERKIG